MIKGGIPKVPPFFSPKVVRYIFLAFDIVAFFVQAMGGG
jgi:hypothetical protein